MKYVRLFRQKDVGQRISFHVRIFGINFLIIVAVVVMVVVYIILNKTTLGKNIYATGGNREAAQVAGINV